MICQGRNELLSTKPGRVGMHEVGVFGVGVHDMSVRSVDVPVVGIYETYLFSGHKIR